MPTKLLWLGFSMSILIGKSAAGPEDTAMNARQPVLVELFTSEGCSSCPPADALLEKLDREQPIAGVQIIVLSEHVDYWNHLGWKDPFSSAAVSARQETYARRFGLNGPYTPEMVVDGRVEFTGSDTPKAESAIRHEIGEPRVGVRIRAAASGDAAVAIEVDPLPAGKLSKANVYVAYAADGGTSDVLRGENRGRTLHHVAIAGDIQQIGSVGQNTMFKRQMRAANGAASSRLVAFVQEPGNGLVRGATMYAIPKGEKPR